MFRNNFVDFPSCQRKIVFDFSTLEDSWLLRAADYSQRGGISGRRREKEEGKGPRTRKKQSLIEVREISVVDLSWCLLVLVVFVAAKHVVRVINIPGVAIKHLFELKHQAPGPKGMLSKFQCS